MNKNCVVWKDRRVKEHNFLLPPTVKEQVNVKEPVEDTEKDWSRN